MVPLQGSMLSICCVWAILRQPRPVSLTGEEAMVYWGGGGSGYWGAPVVCKQCSSGLTKNCHVSSCDGTHQPDNHTREYATPCVTLRPTPAVTCARRRVYLCSEIVLYCCRTVAPLSKRIQRSLLSKCIFPSTRIYVVLTFVPGPMSQVNSSLWMQTFPLPCPTNVLVSRMEMGWAKL